MTAATPVQGAPTWGRCELCEQHRPLFAHRFQIVEYFDHPECDSCDGHDKETVQKRQLCPRCWSNETVRQGQVQAQIDADLGWPDGLSA